MQGRCPGCLWCSNLFRKGQFLCHGMGTHFLRERLHGHFCMFPWTAYPVKASAEVGSNAQWNHWLSCWCVKQHLAAGCFAVWLAHRFGSVGEKPAFSWRLCFAVLVISLEWGFLRAVLNTHHRRCQNILQSSVSFAGFFSLLFWAWPPQGSDLGFQCWEVGVLLHWHHGGALQCCQTGWDWNPVPSDGTAVVGRLVFKHPLQNVRSLEWQCVGLGSHHILSSCFTW